MTVTISDKTARAAMSALQCSIQQKHRRDALDGAPSRRGRFKVTSEDHTAHDEIATALGESTSFAISAHGEPTPDDISKASDLAYLLIRFWAQHSWMGEDKKHLIPPGASSDLADTLTKFCMVSPTTARRIVSTAAKGNGYQLMSMGDWTKAEEVKA